MIKRYEPDDVEYHDVLPDENGKCLLYNEVKHLLAPPWMEPCPECGGDGLLSFGSNSEDVCDCGMCDREETVPIYYTPEEWRQWWVDNELPVQEWKGALLIVLQHEETGRMSMDLSYSATPSEAYARWFVVVTLCAYGPIPGPADDYRHGGK